MPRLWRWLVPFAALIAAASTHAGAEAAPQTLPDLSASAPEARTARAAQASTDLALTKREEQRRADAGETAPAARHGSRPDRRRLRVRRHRPGRLRLLRPDRLRVRPCRHRAAAQLLRPGSLGRPVARDDIRRGDLVFFSTAGAGASHVGVATSSTTVISATNSGVMEHSTQDAYWGGNYVTARRLR